jgi:hypothetical protein
LTPVLWGLAAIKICFRHQSGAILERIDFYAVLSVLIGFVGGFTYTIVPTLSGS